MVFSCVVIADLCLVDGEFSGEHLRSNSSKVGFLFVVLAENASLAAWRQLIRRRIETKRDSRTFLVIALRFVSVIDLMYLLRFGSYGAKLEKFERDLFESVRVGSRLFGKTNKISFVFQRQLNLTLLKLASFFFLLDSDFRLKRLETT